MGLALDEPSEGEQPTDEHGVPFLLDGKLPRVLSGGQEVMIDFDPRGRGFAVWTAGSGTC